MTTGDTPESFFTLLASAVAMVFGLGILLRQMLLVAFTIAGWTGPGVLLTLIAVVLFAFHVWLDEQIPHWKFEYGR